MDKRREEEIERRLLQIHKRVQWMANTEARAAWLRTYGARGEFWNEKKKLLDETDRLFDELEGEKKEE
jgi:hypothetical protein